MARLCHITGFLIGCFLVRKMGRTVKPKFLDGFKNIGSNKLVQFPWWMWISFPHLFSTQGRLGKVKKDTYSPVEDFSPFWRPWGTQRSYHYQNKTPLVQHFPSASLVAAHICIQHIIWMIQLNYFVNTRGLLSPSLVLSFLEKERSNDSFLKSFLEPDNNGNYAAITIW